MLRTRMTTPAAVLAALVVVSIGWLWWDDPVPPVGDHTVLVPSGRPQVAPVDPACAGRPICR